jgi:Small subunit of serine palmitoyltransferase-like
MPAIDSKLPSRPRKSYISSFIRWLQLKKYQYEVTFSLYMLTPTEKLIFSTTSQDIPTICLPLLTHGALDFILLVLISMLVTAATMYLPNHVAVIYNRIWYYVHGEFVHLKGNGNEVLKTTGASIVGSVTKKMMMAETAETVMRKLDEL